MNLTGRVYENKKIRTAVTYLNPLDGKQVCRDVYVSYKITILDKVGCYTYCYKNEVSFDIEGLNEGFVVTGILQFFGEGKKDLEFNGTGLWKSIIETPFGPIEIEYRVNQKIWGDIVNNCKLQLQTDEQGWQNKPVEGFELESSNYALGTNTFCAVRKH